MRQKRAKHRLVRTVQCIEDLVSGLGSNKGAEGLVVLGEVAIGICLQLDDQAESAVLEVPAGERRDEGLREYVGALYPEVLGTAGNPMPFGKEVRNCSDPSFKGTELSPVARRATRSSPCHR